MSEENEMQSFLDGESLVCTADYLYTAYYDAQAFDEFDGSVEIPELDVNLKTSEGFFGNLITGIEETLGISASVIKIILVAVVIFIVKNLLTTSTKDIADIATSVVYLKEGGGGI